MMSFISIHNTSILKEKLPGYSSSFYFHHNQYYLTVVIMKAAIETDFCAILLELSVEKICIGGIVEQFAFFLSINLEGHCD
jgi:hypothetical protein